MAKVQRNERSSPIDFLGIGAQRAGTTWLHHRLSELEEFWLPPIKELHYFDRSSHYPSPNTLSEARFSKRMANIPWLKKMARNYGRQLLNLNYHNLRWLNKMHFSHYDDEWYLSLFGSCPDEIIRGEITPSYSILDIADVERMHKLLPHVKIIFLLRNPVERAWSHYCYSLKKYPHKAKSMQRIPAMAGFFKREAQELRSDYLRTLRHYSLFFPATQILAGFYDAIHEKPADFLSEVIQFLSGGPSNVSGMKHLQARSNPSPGLEMPEEIFHLLKEKYHPMVRELSGLFGGYCRQWYERLYLPGEFQHDAGAPATLTLEMARLRVKAKDND